MEQERKIVIIGAGNAAKEALEEAMSSEAKRYGITIVDTNDLVTNRKIAMEFQRELDRDIRKPTILTGHRTELHEITQVHFPEWKQTSSRAEKRKKNKKPKYKKKK